MSYYSKHDEANVLRLAEQLTETPELDGFEVRRKDYGQPGHFYLAKGDLEILITELSGGDSTGKLCFAGKYPYDEHDSVYGIPDHDIKVSTSRGAAVIAREIMRRLLPPYEASLKEFQEQLQKATARRIKRDELAAELARRLPRGHSSTQGSRSCNVAYFDDGRRYPDPLRIHGTFEVSVSSDVHIDVRTENQEFLLELADLFRKHSA
ncbi:hypothetical protein [Nonomuraea typhae]|uniref:Uncharacterized protein n=1 Tax=Nonomuraea typhae TaxID=2603600 RepID=A0ABW7YJ98_9ACTN